MTSVFSGFVIFSYIGYLAKQTGQTVESVVQAGIELLKKCKLQCW